MSEVKNVTASLEVLAARYLPKPPTHDMRDQLIAELAALRGSETFVIRERDLRLEVPLSVALAHVDYSLLLLVVTAVRDRANILARAAATGAGEMLRDWLRDCPVDEPGDLLELLDNGGVRFVGVDLARDDAAQDALVEEATPVGVVRDDAAGQRFDDTIGAVADRRLIFGQPDPLDHPEPLIPRRSTPPP